MGKSAAHLGSVALAHKCMPDLLYAFPNFSLIPVTMLKIWKNDNEGDPGGTKVAAQVQGTLFHLFVALCLSVMLGGWTPCAVPC